MEEDLFFDLFGEVGCLVPNSESRIIPNGSPDSGHGSSFEASPDSFYWETCDNDGDFWGSILDDIPTDITDVDSDGSEQLPSKAGNVNSNADKSGIWTTEVVEESILNYDDSMEVKSETDLYKNSHISFDHALHLISPTTINNDENYETFKVKSSTSEENSSVSNVPALNLIDQNTQPCNSPVLVKSAPVRKCPTWVVKSSDIKSHIKIGENIFAIVQSDMNGNQDSTDSAPIFMNHKTNDSASMVVNNKGNMTSNINYTDHDYADKEDKIFVDTTGVSTGMGPGLVLTSEEKRLLEMENLTIPEDAPLTKEEEKALKKVRRKIKNKQSAMESRRKRKEYIENLERRVKHCTDLNQGLRKKVDKLTKENKVLVNQLKSMKDFIAASFKQSKASETGTTCLAVLILSFALFILPFNSVFYGGKPENNLPAETANPTTVFRSRTLLSVDDNVEYNYHDNESNVSYYASNYENIIEDLRIHDEIQVKQQFEKYGGFQNELIFNSSISMYIHQNFTLYRSADDIHVDHPYRIS